MSSSRRGRLLATYAELTRDLLKATAAGHFEELPRFLAARQRIIDQVRSIDAPAAALTPEERALAEAAQGDERRALDRMAARRQQLLSSFREVAKSRRAVTGYRPRGAAIPRILDRTA